MDSLINTVEVLHIEKVNELEEKITQLRKYNKDLRYELAQKNRVTVKTSDEHENDDEDPDLSFHSASDNHRVPSSWFNNELVMDNIFGYLDVKQLNKCRLICKDWNEAISSILRKRNNGNGLGVYLTLDDLDEDEDGFVEDGYVTGDDLKRNQEIHSIVKAAPENWFRSVNLVNNRWTADAYRTLFQDFGNRLKVIKVTDGDINIPTLCSILVDWCPNLEELVFDELDLQFGEDQELQIIQPLKLTRLSFSVEGGYDSIIFGDVRLTEVLFTIIRNSPNLKKLESFGWSTTIVKQLISKLQNYPQIMNNLEEIFLRTAPCGLLDFEADPLEALSNTEFTSKLKKLVLTNIKPGKSIDLNRLLNTTNESLENLILISDAHLDLSTSVQEPSFQLKQMNRLLEFRYHAHRQGLMNSFDILGKMPNLRIFVLGFDDQYSSDYHEDDFIDVMFSNCRQLREIPHQNLRELYLFGFIQKPKDTFDIMERGFPNLNKLVVGICDKEEENYGDFSDLFKGMSKLKKLNKLFLDLSSFQCDSVSSYRIGRILSDFEKLPNLIHLALRGGELYFDEVLFMSKMPKLQRLTLIGVKMDLTKAKKLGQLLDERAIFLDIKEGYQFPDDGIELDLEF